MDFKLKNPRDLESPFDLVQFPSMGIFYKDHRSGILVKYLTGVEENILTSPILSMTGESMKMALNRLIMEEGVDVSKLLVGDRNAILLYLRATSFGDEFKLALDCPSCNMSANTYFNISEIQAKDVNVLPDENMEYGYTLPYMKIDEQPVSVKFRNLTVEDEEKIEQTLEIERKKTKSKPKSITLKYLQQITEINKIRDKEYLEKIIRKFKIQDSSALRKYMDYVEPGIVNKIIIKCKNCTHTYSHDFIINKDFLGLSENYKNILWEEVFLTWYHSKGGISRTEGFSMATAERRWAIQRISEEIDKQNEAERNASSSTK